MAGLTGPSGLCLVVAPGATSSGISCSGEIVPKEAKSTNF